MKIVKYFFISIFIIVLGCILAFDIHLFFSSDRLRNGWTYKDNFHSIISNYYHMPENDLYFRLAEIGNSALLLIGKDSLSLANVRLTNDSPSDLPDSINFIFDKNLCYNDESHFYFAVDSLSNFFVWKRSETTKWIDFFPSFNYTRYEHLEAYDYRSNFEYRASDGTMCIKEGWVEFWIIPYFFFDRGYGVYANPSNRIVKIGSDLEKKKRKQLF